MERAQENVTDAQDLAVVRVETDVLLVVAQHVFQDAPLAAVDAMQRVEVDAIQLALLVVQVVLADAEADVLQPVLQTAVVAVDQVAVGAEVDALVAAEAGALVHAD